MENCCAWVSFSFLHLFLWFLLKNKKNISWGSIVSDVAEMFFYKIQDTFFLNNFERNPQHHWRIWRANFFLRTVKLFYKTNEPFSSMWLCENAWEFESLKMLFTFHWDRLDYFLHTKRFSSSLKKFNVLFTRRNISKW